MNWILVGILIGLTLWLFVIWPLLKKKATNNAGRILSPIRNMYIKQLRETIKRYDIDKEELYDDE